MQSSSTSSSQVEGDSNLPPSYGTVITESAPPAYFADDPASPMTPGEESVIHYILPTDSLTALSLRYRTPLQVLRSYNRLWADNLLGGRAFLLVPSSHYSGP